MSQCSASLSTVANALQTIQRASLILNGIGVLRVGLASPSWSDALLGVLHVRSLSSAAGLLRCTSVAAVSVPSAWPSPCQKHFRSSGVADTLYGIRPGALHNARCASSDSSAATSGHASGAGAGSGKGGRTMTRGGRSDCAGNSSSSSGAAGDALTGPPSVKITDNTGRELTTLRFYVLPELRAPRTDAEQRCLQAALAVVAKLRTHGYTGMFAGGWVRDQFLGRPSQDIDIVTNATTTEMMDVFGRAHCRLKGGSTCDVAWDGHPFEVTTYRGGLRDGYPPWGEATLAPGMAAAAASAEHHRVGGGGAGARVRRSPAMDRTAEYRDAASRDFTLNALFFEPDFGEQAASTSTSSSPTSSSPSANSDDDSDNPASSPPSPSARDPSARQPGPDSSSEAPPQAGGKAGGGRGAGARGARGEARRDAGSGAPSSNGEAQQELPGPDAPPGRLREALSRAHSRHLQPAGVVKDYVGGVADLASRVLRVYPDFRSRLGMYQSSVKEDPIRVLRAARLSEELSLQLDGVTLREVRAAAALCHFGANGVSHNRVFRELAKMADLDSGDGGGDGGGKAGGDGRRRREEAGSPRFAAALARCCEWGALRALFPDLPQDHLEQVIREVIPRLPRDLPPELKLSCLVAAHSEGDFLPRHTAAAYQPIRRLLEGARQAAHWPDLLASLSRLLLTDTHADRERLAWIEFMAAEGSEKVELAYIAFVAGNDDLRRTLHQVLAANRTHHEHAIRQARARRAPASSGGAAAAARSAKEQARARFGAAAAAGGGGGGR